MRYICKNCGVNEVDNQGGICEFCAIEQDPYEENKINYSCCQIDSSLNNKETQSDNNSYFTKKSVSRKILLNGGKSLNNRDPYGNDMTVVEQKSNVKTCTVGQVQVPQNNTIVKTSTTTVALGNQPLTKGIVKNISVSNKKKSIISKWFRTILTGIPFTFDDDVMMFQVFPDFSGTALNALGNACDQVIVYGKLNNGAINENNDVEVYGHRDANNNIIAKIIKNKASGTTITPSLMVSQGTAFILMAVIMLIFIIMISQISAKSIIWLVVIILCITNFSKILKFMSFATRGIFSMIKKMFR